MWRPMGRFPKVKNQRQEKSDIPCCKSRTENILNFAPREHEAPHGRFATGIIAKTYRQVKDDGYFEA